MSIHTITCDDFIMLNVAHHQLAIRLFTAEINALISRLADYADTTSPAYEQASDELLQCMQLRKVHQARQKELEAEETDKAPLSAMQQYEQNERHDLAA